MRFCSASLLAFLLLSAAPITRAQPSAKIVLTERLAKWREEIEALGGGKMVLARVYADVTRTQVYLPKDAEERPIIIPYLRNTSFLKDFLATHAINVNHKSPDGSYYIILLNMSRVAEWSEHEEAVLAQQFGHAWLYALNYPFPAYEGKPDSCLAMLAADAVQSVLIQDELKRRSIRYLDYWIPLLDQTLDYLQREDTPTGDQLPLCPLMAKLSLWIKVRLTLSPETWDHYDAFTAAMKKKYPILAKQQDEVYQIIGGSDLHDMHDYQRALEDVLNMMYGFAKLVLGEQMPEQSPPIELKVTPIVIQPDSGTAPGKK